MKWLFGLAALAALAQPGRVDVRVDARGPVEIPFDAPAVRVMRNGVEVPSQISEELEAGVPGRLSWLAAGPGVYTLYFSHRPNLQRERQPIGNGDNLFYNRPNGFDPLGVGMKNDQAFVIDWDGDGVNDIVQRNIYSSTFGQPYWGLYFWRNIGSEREPRFDRYIRLRAAGNWIDDPYASFQFTDWDRDGLVDILIGVGAGKERGRLKIYRNTGRRDVNRLPILEAGPYIEREGGADLSYGMRLLAGALFTLKVHVQYFLTQETNFAIFRHPRLNGAFGRGDPVTLAGATQFDAWPSDQYDVDRDGKPDWIGATRGPGKGPLKTCIVAWINDKPAGCIIDTTPEGFAIPLSASPWPGLLVSHQGSWLRRFEQQGSSWFDRGVLQARGMPVSSGGYNGLDVVDWDRDGDLDLIMGNETGFVHLVENISTRQHTRFTATRIVNGNMYAARWQFITDEDPERPFGQAKPAVVDWDGDGDLDILVGNNSNRIAYFERTGTTFKPMVPLQHDAGETFSFRAQPSPIDWNGDGLIDLIAGSSAGVNRNTGTDVAISLYLRYRDKDGTLKLRAPQSLYLIGGAEIRTPIPYHHGYKAVDWDGDGDIDIFACEKSHVVLYRNENGRFRREPVLYYGKPLSVSHHETSVSAVDWDKDGKLDLLLGGESGRVYYFHRTTLESATPPKVELMRRK
ncbi:MAG: VCBS repeat-containing protein [Acidobacteria bacterium]|nr:VCBS repeat-containing protein [Acidobacteriota bacterium]